MNVNVVYSIRAFEDLSEFVRSKYLEFGMGQWWTQDVVGAHLEWFGLYNHAEDMMGQWWYNVLDEQVFEYMKSHPEIILSIGELPVVPDDWIEFGIVVDDIKMLERYKDDRLRHVGCRIMTVKDVLWSDQILNSLTVTRLYYRIVAGQSEYVSWKVPDSIRWLKLIHEDSPAMTTGKFRIRPNRLIEYLNLDNARLDRGEWGYQLEKIKYLDIFMDIDSDIRSLKPLVKHKDQLEHLGIFTVEIIAIQRIFPNLKSLYVGNVVLGDSNREPLNLDVLSISMFNQRFRLTNEDNINALQLVQHPNPSLNPRELPHIPSSVKYLSIQMFYTQVPSKFIRSIQEQIATIDSLKFFITNINIPGNYKHTMIVDGPSTDPRLPEVSERVDHINHLISLASTL